ncbi:hypothetical protein, partial [Mycolicibacterium alvei]|uniref:hypothetical protein n=1 Tax=Mycolicibacterium alvei TaxID=67081 RepID=UPI0031D3BEFE
AEHRTSTPAADPGKYHAEPARQPATAVSTLGHGDLRRFVRMSRGVSCRFVVNYLPGIQSMKYSESYLPR